MPLKRLELSNFKSYRGQQEIDFGPSFFTCIIGPNGSGKSNLMDAISFVLGVKSNQLRSSQLKELIYRGRKAAAAPDQEDLDPAAPATKGKSKGQAKAKGKDAAQAKLGKRKKRDDDLDESDDDEEDEEDEEEDEEEQDDQGSENDAKTAWVMAVYEDQTGKEWKFKRSIGRTGTSTYHLNGSNVTYTAYNQALEKHNILVKAKNFLVFQGDVEAVASQSPKDLARLIDQISGSLDLAPEYLKAKARADKSTDLTTLNYSKKRGIASEYKQFKEQKAEVDRWESMQAEKADVLVRYLLWKLFHIDSNIEAAEAKIEEGKSSLDSLIEEQTVKEKELVSAKKKQAKVNLEVKKHETAVKTAERTLDDKRPELLKLQTQIQHAQKKITSSENIAKGLEKDVARQQTTVNNLKKDLVDAQEAEERAAEAQREASQKQGVSLNAADLKEYGELKTAANALAVEERQQLEILKREERSLRDKLATATDKINKAESRREELKQELSSVEAREVAQRGRVDEFERERRNLQKQMDTLQAERSKYNQLETEINEKLQEAYNKLLQAKVDRRESDREVKLKEALANLRKVFPGVHGRVIDLCKPTQQKYNVAIQVVLGRNIDSVVVDHQKTAIECIEYMRNQRAGQATFIPLDTIQHKNDAVDKFRSIHKGARLAIDVIQYEPTVERAMQYACGTSLVCDTEEIAKHIRYTKNLAVKAVTLEGTVIHKSGLITGGQGSGSGRKFDDVEIAGIEKNRDALLAKLKEMQAKKPKSDSENNLTTSISRVNASLAIAKDHLHATSRTAEGLRSEIKALTTSMTKLQSELKASSAKHSTHAAKVAQISDIVDQADDDIFEQFCARIGVESIRDYENVQLRAAAMENEALLNYRTQIARLNHQLKFEEKQLSATQTRLQAVRALVDRETANIEVSLQVSEATLEEEIQQAEAELEEKQEALERIREAYAEESKKVDDCRKAHGKAVKAVDQVKKEIAALYDDIESQAAERFAIYKRCKLEEIELPLESGSLAKVPIEESRGLQSTIEGEDATQRSLPSDFGIEVDFDDLEDDEREDSSESMAKAFESKLATLTSELEKVAPNLKAVDKLADVEQKMKATEREAEEAKRENREAKEAFNKVKKKRCDLFNKAFNHISERIDPVYKELTKGKAAPHGGVAYLSLEDSDEPYLSGVKYHAMPPMKRFRDMEQLSGGEKTMAALALLFAIHSYQPSPFFVLDEVDAALDNTNVARIANYIQTHSSASFQFIVISLKGSLYERSNSLVGIYRDQDVNSSRSLTLDLQKYDE